MSNLVRKPVPAIIPQKMRMGSPGIIHRSFPCGKHNFLRITENQSLHLDISFKEGIENPQVVLHTNLPTNDKEIDKWKNIPFNAKNPREFELNLPVTRSGIFQFKVKYSLDNGLNWFWDRGPYSYVLVDPAGMEPLKMYSLIPNASGTFRDWIDMLPHIKGMGFNYIHLLPITMMDSSRSPYAAKSLFIPDSQYADPNDSRSTIEQFESFAEECKRHGISLCIDLVLNHVGITSEIAMTTPTWIVPDNEEPDGLKRAGWADYNHWYKWEDLALLNYEHPNRIIRRDLWEYMKDYVLFWTNYADYTNGMIRFDNFHSSNEKFVLFVMKHLRQNYPNIKVLAEFFSDEETMAKMTIAVGLNLLLATPWSAKFAPQVRAYLRHIHQIGHKMKYFFPISSHDSGTPTEEFCSVKATMPRYIISALFSTGYTGITQGVEFGMPNKINFIAQTEKIDMNTGYNFCDFIRSVNNSMEWYKEFQVTGNIHFIDNGHDAILAAFRPAVDEYSDYCGFILLCNLDTNNEQHISINLSELNLAVSNKIQTKFHEIITDHWIEMNVLQDLQIILKPGESKVLKIMKN